MLEVKTNILQAIPGVNLQACSQWHSLANQGMQWDAVAI